MEVATPPSRFERKREQILEAATTLINERGASGMTMRDVGHSVNLTSATLTYYFKGKEDLAEAVFNRRLDSLERTIAEAATARDPYHRVERLLSLEIERLANVFAGRALPLAALPSPNQNADFSAVHKRIRQLFEAIHRLFEGEGPAVDPSVTRARSYMVIGLMFYMHTWLAQYPVEEFPRIHARIMSLLETGLATPDFHWDPVVFDVDGPTGLAADGSRPAFLRIATRLLNDCGYLGTSVDSIVDELNVTKGSFYHHLASKDELILEAVRTNFQRIAAAIAQARAGGGSQAQQLSSAIATLVDLQFRREWPLLRSTAYASLPPALRAEVGGGSRRTALTFASMLIDGITEGSVRAVDPLIASNVINSTLYSALGLREWSTQQRNERAIALYASTLMFGIFDPDVLTKLDRD